MTQFSAIMSAFSQELADISTGLTALQNVPLLSTSNGAPLAGADLLRAMVALQDLDRLAQTADALAGLAARMAQDGEDCNSDEALSDVPLVSVADRLRHRLTAALVS